MNSNSESEQKAIVDWFDSVYRRRGSSYLRPKKAYLVFMELLDAQPEQRLLDVACGLGLLLQAAEEYLTGLYGVDISEVAIAKARKNVPAATFAVANANRLPYPDESFDLVTCLGSLERMLDVVAVLEEMKRVGKNDAKYCFLVRNSNTLSWKYLGWLTSRQRSQGHAGANSLRNWRALFEGQGFRVTDVLPDQYPLHRRKQLASLLIKPVDFRKPIVGRMPIEEANEFVFLLEKLR